MGIAIGGILSGLGGLKLFERVKRNGTEGIDAEIGRASAAEMVQRAEDRMRELHRLREDQNIILGGFDKRLVAVEKDTKQTQESVSELKDNFKEGNRKLDAILERVWSMSGNRRQPGGKRDPQ